MTAAKNIGSFNQEPGYITRLQITTRLVKNSGAKYCISNHINAATNQKAQGAEVIHSMYADNKLATAIMDELVKEGLQKRRVFYRASSIRPTKDYYFMHRLTCPVETVILEYGFASNDTDKKIFISFGKPTQRPPSGVFVTMTA